MLRHTDAARDELWQGAGAHPVHTAPLQIYGAGSRGKQNVHAKKQLGAPEAKGNMDSLCAMAASFQIATAWGAEWELYQYNPNQFCRARAGSVQDSCFTGGVAQGYVGLQAS